MLHYNEGRYKATIERWGLSTSKNKGTPQIVFTVIPQQVLDNTTGEYVTAEGGFERSIYLYVTENTIERVAQDLAKLGYPHDTFDQLDPEHPHRHDFYGQEIEVQCRHEEWEGKKRERWELAWDGGFKHEPMDTKGVRKLNALFGKQLKQYRSNAKPERPVPAPNTEEEAAEVL